MASLPMPQVLRRSSNNQRDRAASIESLPALVSPSEAAKPQELFDEAQIGVNRPPEVQEGDDVKRCWICFEDETDDTPESSPWRSPCPCALVAHEACLLDWIADKEAPTLTRTTAAPVKIECPQCKSEIRLARPHSRVVEIAAAVEKQSRKLIFPGIVLGVSQMIFLTCSWHGSHTIDMIFGADEADAILAPVVSHGWFEWQALRIAPTIAQPLLRNWRGLRVELGLPLIPATLVASRTTLADVILPIIPLVFFATQRETRDIFSSKASYWPPTPAHALIILPYVRSLYDEYMERVWGDRERAWVKEIQPRFAQANNAAVPAANINDEVVLEEGDNVVEIDLEINIEAFMNGNADEGDNTDEEEFQQINNEMEDGTDQPRPPHHLNDAPQPHPPVHNHAQQFPENLDFDHEAIDIQRPPDFDENDEPIPQLLPVEDPIRVAPIPAAVPLPAPPPPVALRREAGLVIYLTRTASTVLGALLFPSISALVGEALRLALPLSWTTPAMLGWGSRSPRRAGLPTGLLQTRWGRSVVGGCLFVVLKDAVRVYCKWRMAVSYRTRRVLDFEGKRGSVGR